MNPNEYEVLIFPTAERDLLDIKDYFENKLLTSPQGLFQKFYDYISLLEINPLIHPLVKDSHLNQLGYRMFPIDNFLVFYVIENDKVQIHRFLYGKRNYLVLL